MHKMNTTLHKSANTKGPKNIITTLSIPPNKIDEDKDNLPMSLTMEIEKVNRLSKIISLCSKGLSQHEIAREMGVNESTISRDLQYIKGEARKQIEKYLRKDILFEFVRYIAGSNEITKKLWDIVENKDTTPKEKINALSLLMQLNDKRLERLIGGPGSYKDIKKNLSDITFQDFLDSDPLLRASADIEKLASKDLFSK